MSDRNSGDPYWYFHPSMPLPNLVQQHGQTQPVMIDNDDVTSSRSRTRRQGWEAYCVHADCGAWRYLCSSQHLPLSCAVEQETVSRVLCVSCRVSTA